MAVDPREVVEQAQAANNESGIPADVLAEAVQAVGSEAQVEAAESFDVALAGKYRCTSTGRYIYGDSTDRVLQREGQRCAETGGQWVVEEGSMRNFPLGGFGNRYRHRDSNQCDVGAGVRVDNNGNIRGGGWFQCR